LAASLALRARDAGIELLLQSLSCPVVDPRAMHADDPDHSAHGPSPTLTREAVIAMWEHYLGDDIDDPPVHTAPSLASDHRGVAPAHVVVAECDVLRDEGTAYAWALSTAGVSTTLRRFGGTVHGFDGLLPDSSVGQRAIASQVEALAFALRR
ncbi:MAG: alpha/beta hydrolase fold domain-containing protein, partial [Actinomycetota bacterium]